MTLTPNCLRSAFQPRPRQQQEIKKPKPLKPLTLNDFKNRRRARLTEKDRRLIVCLRFGSLTDHSSPRCSVTDIAKLLDIKMKTVSQQLVRLRRNGYDTRVRFSSGRRRIPVPPDVVVALTTTEKMKEWSALSLKDRCLLIQRDYGVPMTTGRLREIYRRANLRYVRPEIHSVRQAELG